MVSLYSSAMPFKCDFIRKQGKFTSILCMSVRSYNYDMGPHDYVLNMSGLMYPKPIWFCILINSSSKWSLVYCPPTLLPCSCLVLACAFQFVCFAVQMDNSPTTGSVTTTVAEKQRLAKASLAFNCKKWVHYTLNCALLYFFFSQIAQCFCMTLLKSFNLSTPFSSHWAAILDCVGL